MASAKFSFFQTNTTGFLIVQARKTLTPQAVEKSKVYAPPLQTITNVQFDDLAPAMYFFDFYVSPDGVQQGLLVGEFTIDVKNNIVQSEKRYYTYQTITTSVIDPYLDGKNVTGVFKEGFRFLQPTLEYTLAAGGGVNLVGLDLQPGEVLTVDISYLTNVVTQSGGTGLFEGAVTVFNSQALNETHYNNLIDCSSPSSRLVLTLPPATSIPDGKFFYFVGNTGFQLQTRVMCQGTDLIQFASREYTELSFGKGEILWIEKRGIRFRLLSDGTFLNMVGEDVIHTALQPNTLPQDARIYHGDDFPRLYYWIANVLPLLNKIVVSDAQLDAFVHPADKAGMFVMCSDSRRFRMPNLQGQYIRGADTFTNPGVQAAGITQGGQVGEIVIPGKQILKGGTATKVTVLNNITDPLVGTENIILNQGKENLVKGVRKIYSTRI